MTTHLLQLHPCPPHEATDACWLDLTPPTPPLSPTISLTPPPDPGFFELEEQIDDGGRSEWFWDMMDMDSIHSIGFDDLDSTSAQVDRIHDAIPVETSMKSETEPLSIEMHADALKLEAKLEDSLLEEESQQSVVSATGSREGAMHSSLAEHSPPLPSIVKPLAPLASPVAVLPESTLLGQAPTLLPLPISTKPQKRTPKRKASKSTGPSSLKSRVDKRSPRAQLTLRKRGDDERRRKRGRERRNGKQDEGSVEVKDRCSRCDVLARFTPMMRKGPDGCRSLCNACGLKWSRHGIL